jgi:hypothetical protein
VGGAEGGGDDLHAGDEKGSRGEGFEPERGGDGGLRERLDQKKAKKMGYTK